MTSPSNDITIEDGRILSIRPTPTDPGTNHDRTEGSQIIDGTGLLALPSFVDTHRHTWQSAIKHTATPNWTRGCTSLKCSKAWAPPTSPKTYTSATNWALTRRSARAPLHFSSDRTCRTPRNTPTPPSQGCATPGFGQSSGTDGQPRRTTIGQTKASSPTPGHPKGPEGILLQRSLGPQDQPCHGGAWTGRSSTGNPV